MEENKTQLVFQLTTVDNQQLYVSTCYQHRRKNDGENDDSDEDNDNDNSNDDDDNDDKNIILQLYVNGKTTEMYTLDTNLPVILHILHCKFS